MNMKFNPGFKLLCLALALSLYAAALDGQKHDGQEYIAKSASEIVATIESIKKKQKQYVKDLEHFVSNLANAYSDPESKYSNIRVRREERLSESKKSLAAVESELKKFVPHIKAKQAVEIDGVKLKRWNIKSKVNKLKREQEQFQELIDTLSAQLKANNVWRLAAVRKRASLMSTTRNVKTMLADLEDHRQSLANLRNDEIIDQNKMSLTEEFQELKQEVNRLCAQIETDLQQEKTYSGKKAEWIPLFNGRNLDGWTAKIRGHELGDNFGDTFRVEDGILKVNYDAYGDKYQNRFGHLFYKNPYSHYIIRAEYRFVGEQMGGAPGWALRNSGIMLHCQDPKTMERDQDFPVSIEVQLLGGDGTNRRTNANLCTPGTNVEMDGKLVRRHCIDSTSETFHGDRWVTVEVQVYGDEEIRHVIDGKTVLKYNKPQLDDRDKNAQKLIKDGNLALNQGFISIQSESHPIEFRKIEIQILEK